MHSYLGLLNELYCSGVERDDRTGVGTVGVFGRQLHFDLSQGFPLLTTKKIHFKSVVYELLWLLSGSTNIAFLNEHGISIWDEWADSEGELGPIYGKQWRSWQCPDGRVVDQITEVIQSLRDNPYSRRHIVSAWNPADTSKMSLPPCHCLFQFYVAEGKLSCHMYQRSADIFLGVPFNIASYALLTHMVAQCVNLKPGELVISYGDVHLYKNHKAQADEQLSRAPRNLPTLGLNPRLRDIFEFTYSDILLKDYDPHPRIQASVAV